jgi:hypothetical protein
MDSSDASGPKTSDKKEKLEREQFNDLSTHLPGLMFDQLLSNLWTWSVGLDTPYFTQYLTNKERRYAARSYRCWYGVIEPLSLSVRLTTVAAQEAMGMFTVEKV